MINKNIKVGIILFTFLFSISFVLAVGGHDVADVKITGVGQEFSLNETIAENVGLAKKLDDAYKNPGTATSFSGYPSGLWSHGITPIAWHDASKIRIKKGTKYYSFQEYFDNGIGVLTRSILEWSPIPVWHDAANILIGSKTLQNWVDLGVVTTKQTTWTFVIPAENGSAESPWNEACYEDGAYGDNPFKGYSDITTPSTNSDLTLTNPEELYVIGGETYSIECDYEGEDTVNISVQPYSGSTVRIDSAFGSTPQTSVSNVTTIHRADDIIGTGWFACRNAPRYEGTDIFTYSISLGDWGKYATANVTRACSGVEQTSGGTISCATARQEEYCPVYFYDTEERFFTCKQSGLQEKKWPELKCTVSGLGSTQPPRSSEL